MKVLVSENPSTNTLERALETEADFHDFQRLLDSDPKLTVSLAVWNLIALATYDPSSSPASASEIRFP